LNHEIEYLELLIPVWYMSLRNTLIPHFGTDLYTRTKLYIKRVIPDQHWYATYWLWSFLKSAKAELTVLIGWPDFAIFRFVTLHLLNGYMLAWSHRLMHWWFLLITLSRLPLFIVSTYYDDTTQKDLWVMTSVFCFQLLRFFWENLSSLLSQFQLFKFLIEPPLQVRTNFLKLWWNLLSSSIPSGALHIHYNFSPSASWWIWCCLFGE
jgi:hypothetical protein